MRCPFRRLQVSGEKIALCAAAEQSILGALLSRFIDLVPQTYTVEPVMGGAIATIRQHFNPFVLRYTMTIHGSNPEIDPRLLTASGILLASIERRQE
jgi:hypothetical protein